MKFETTFLIEKCRKKAGEIKGGFWNWKKLPNCTEKKSQRVFWQARFQLNVPYIDSYQGIL